MDVSLTQSITMRDRGLDAPLPDGATAYFNYHWLRDNCPTSIDPQTRERVFDIFGEAEPPRPATARIVDAALEIVWAADGHVSHYPLERLAGYATGRPRHDPADLPRRLWHADHYPDIRRFSQAALMADKAEVFKWVEALLVDGVAIVTDMPDSDAGLTETASLVGHVRPTFWGSYFDVRTHIRPTNLAYTAKALELHTDTPPEEMAPGVQFLHCRANSVAGGNSLFVDGAAVAAAFRALYPEDFALLAETEIPFNCEHDDYDMRARQRVIELDGHGEVSGITISQHLADVIDLPQDLLDRYYPAFCRFGRMLRDDKFLMRFRLDAGECITFDNHRIAHGREAYSATSGERYLRGCYTDRGEMRSTYRVLAARGGAA